MTDKCPQCKRVHPIPGVLINSSNGRMRIAVSVGDQEVRSYVDTLRSMHTLAALIGMQLEDSYCLDNQLSQAKTHIAKLEDCRAAEQTASMAIAHACLNTGLVPNDIDSTTESVKAVIRGKDGRIAELEAIVDKLPKYADTGERFIPGHDDAYVVEGDLVSDVLAGTFDLVLGWGWTITVNGHGVYGPAYSTPEAAEAANEASTGPGDWCPVCRKMIRRGQPDIAGSRGEWVCPDCGSHTRWIPRGEAAEKERP